MEKGHGRDNRHHAAHDVHQVAVYKIRPEELRQPERDAHYQYGRQHLKSLAPTHHRPHQPERHNHRRERKDAPDHGIQVGFRQSRDGR